MTPSTPDDIREIATTVQTWGLDLHITENTSAGELIITNPTRPDRGHAAVSLEDGHVSWTPHHPGSTGPRDHYGHLEGITTDHDNDHTPEGALPVPALMIIHLLTADTG